jgi:hypothetical protein
MPDNQYPVFEGGQTLTRGDLNQLRTFGQLRDRLLGRLVGFGVNSGLGATVSGMTLTIDAGLAIDQVGEPLVLPEAQTIALPPEPSPGSFDFVASDAGGFSVVLESSDVAEPAPDCGQAGCEGHAELHTRGVALRIAAGRITGPRFDFAGEALLTVQPLRLSLTSAPQGSFVTLRDALVTRLGNGGSPLIDPAQITRLQGISIAPSDLPGVKGYKAGFLNQVLFATLDLLRCRALTATTVDRSTARPGVVLGWVEQVGGTWVWECAYRHAWEPPHGLSLAIAGAGCASPCSMWVAVLEGLIAGYAPPDPPPVEEDDDGPIIVYPLCPKGTILVGGKCVLVYFPPPKIPDRWAIPWEIDPREPIDPLGPIWNPPDMAHHVDEIVREVYDADAWEFFGKGVIGGLPALGRDANIARTSLEAQIADLGGTPNVEVLTAAQAAALPGYQPGASFNAADTIVLTKGTNNKVTAVGRVPAAHTARELGTALPAATAKASQALEATAVQQTGLDAITDRVGGLAQDVTNLEDFRQATVQWRGQVDSVLDGVGHTIDVQVQDRVSHELGVLRLDDLQRRVSIAEGQIDVIVKGSGQPRRPLDAGVARGMVDFAGSLTDGLASLVTAENQDVLGRHIGAATRASTALEEAAASGEPQEIGDATVRLLGTLRTAVKSAGIDPALGDQLDAQLNAIRGLVG